MTKLDPKDLSPHHLLGQIFYDFEQDTAAIEQLRQGLRISSTSDRRIAMQRLLSQSLLRHRSYEESLEVLKGLEPDGWVLAMQADALWKLGRKEEAQATLANAKTLAPDERLVLSVGSRFHLAAGEIEQAIPLLEKLLVLDANDAESRYQRALAYKRTGRPAESEIEMKRYEESREALHTLAELNRKAMAEPRNAELRDEIAEICERLGKKELGVVWRRAATTIRELNTPSDVIGRSKSYSK